jgi:hypothetical protein
MTAVWISGPTRSGKTTQLVQRFERWAATGDGNPQAAPPGILVLSAVSANRGPLQDHLTLVSQARLPFRHTTPLGFLEDEVKLFWALLVEQLNLKPQFPLRLRPETEQAFAEQLWTPELDRVPDWSPRRRSRFVRQILDLMQLITLSHQPIKYLPDILQQAVGDNHIELPLPYATIATMLLNWQQWCRDRGLLTYALIVDLYGQYLLADQTYLDQLHQRFQLILADDVDEYPAIVRSLFETFLARDGEAVFTFNPNGAVRLGLGADPDYMADLSQECEVVMLPNLPHSLAPELSQPVLELVDSPVYFANLPPPMQTIQATTRAQLIRQTAETIIAAVQSGQVTPAEIAIIGPGLDGISRYAFETILQKQGIELALLNDQRPLASAAIVRSLLTLLALIYPGLGRQVNRHLVAEMLVSLAPTVIDPVRAGLIADHCFEPDVTAPKLLPGTTFPRWDRLGFAASQAYEALRVWIMQQQAIVSPNAAPTDTAPIEPNGATHRSNPVSLLDRAMQQFFLAPSLTPDFEQLAILRALMETAQHYWELDGRLQSLDGSGLDATGLDATGLEGSVATVAATVGRFIRLLRQGTITANPLRLQPIAPAPAVTLATVFQYRSSRQSHRWQFWFDAGSSRWLNGVDSLFGAPFFLQSYGHAPWTVDDQSAMNEQRLQRILQDLLGRSTDRVFLCYSDLATNGQEQLGVLLSLVNAATPYSPEPAATVRS